MGPVTNHFDQKGYKVTTGIGPDLMQASRDAVGSMIDLLCKDTGMDAVEAYMLCSVCGDLRISEIVDMPNWTVSFYFPKVVLNKIKSDGNPALDNFPQVFHEETNLYKFTKIQKRI